MASRIQFIAVLTLALSGCRSTTPGTAVEVTSQGGEEVYVAGAAGDGFNRDQACGLAVQRSINSMAEEFAERNDDIGDDVADEVGVKDGKAFLIRYAKYDAQSADVGKENFNPVEHLCTVIVRWKPPVFVKQAVLKYAEALKAGELADAPQSPTSSAAPAAPTAPAAPAAPAAPQSPPPAPAYVTPAPSAAPAPAPSSRCTTERRVLVKALDSASGKVDEFAECKRRTEGDETICHRYKLYVEEAEAKQVKAGSGFASCLNNELPADLRSIMRDAAPTHGATVVENLDDGTRVLWAYSPVDKTGYVFQVATDGTIRDKRALAANQVQWTREKLGLN